MTLETIYDGDGSDVTFNTDFDYLEEEDISVAVKPSGGSYATKTLDTHYTVSGQVVTFTSGNTPPNNSKVRIRRHTPVTHPRHTFYAGSAITAKSLNDNVNQVLNALEERGLAVDDETDQPFTIGTHNEIKVNSATNLEVVPGSITKNHMAINSVDSDQYVDGSIDRVHLAADIIDGTKIKNDCINSEHYVNASIDHVHLSNDCIDGDNIKNNVINSEHYRDGSIDNEHLANDAVDSAELADGAVDLAHLSASGTKNSTTFLRGDNSWTVPTGGIIQVVQTLKTDTTSHTGSAEADIAGMTCTITPTSSSHKVLVILTVTFSMRHSSYISLYRGSTKIGAGDAVSGKIDALFGGYPGSSNDGAMYFGMWAHTHQILDSPNTTSATTYKLAWRSEENSAKYLNYGFDNVDHSGRGSSAITLMEVAV